MKLALSQIRLDGGTQSRAALNEQALADYCDAMGDGEVFPPVVVFHDGSTYWLADGFHRVRAAERACLIEINADVRQGGRRDAVLFSVGANGAHGLRRTNEDKKRAVRVLLEDAEWSAWSDREIARRAGVSNQFVSNLRQRPSVNGGQIEPRKVERNGATYEMQTANIGAKKAAPAASAPPPAPVAQPAAPVVAQPTATSPSRTAKPTSTEDFFADLHARLASGERGTPIADEDMLPAPAPAPSGPPSTRPAMPTGERDRLTADARASRLLLAVGQALSVLLSEAPAEDRIASAVRVLLAAQDGGSR